MGYQESLLHRPRAQAPSRCTFFFNLFFYIVADGLGVICDCKTGPRDIAPVVGEGKAPPGRGFQLRTALRRRAAINCKQRVPSPQPVRVHCAFSGHPRACNVGAPHKHAKISKHEVALTGGKVLNHGKGGRAAAGRGRRGNASGSASDAGEAIAAGHAKRGRGGAHGAACLARGAGRA